MLWIVHHSVMSFAEPISSIQAIKKMTRQTSLVPWWGDHKILAICFPRKKTIYLKANYAAIELPKRKKKSLYHLMNTPTRFGRVNSFPQQIYSFSIALSISLCLHSKYLLGSTQSSKRSGREFMVSGSSLPLYFLTYYLHVEIKSWYRFTLPYIEHLKNFKKDCSTLVKWAVSTAVASTASSGLKCYCIFWRTQTVPHGYSDSRKTGNQTKYDVMLPFWKVN